MREKPCKYLDHRVNSSCKALRLAPAKPGWLEQREGAERTVGMKNSNTGRRCHHKLCLEEGMKNLAWGTQKRFLTGRNMELCCEQWIIDIPCLGTQVLGAQALKNIASGGCRIGKGIFRGKAGGLERIGKSLKSLVNKGSCREERLLEEIAWEVNLRLPREFYATYGVLDVRMNCENFTNIWKKERVFQQ